MDFKTGKGSISLAALLGVWSVSALTSLPGLAVSPILGDLSRVFPSATDLDIQMLTSLPSLMIVPFILLSGWFTEHFGYMKLLYCGLGIFLLSGILYFFCDSMGALLAVSALLGVGAGIIIPLSTSLVSRFFVGRYRTMQFGYSSAITNVALVLATAFAGYLAEWYWKATFAVYLFPIFSIMLMPFVARADRVIPYGDTGSATQVVHRGGNKRGVLYNKLCMYMAYYFLITYLTIIINFNLPFLMSEHGYDSGVAGLIISLFFLSMMMPGFFLPSILRYLKDRVAGACLMMIAVGLLLIYLYSSLPLIALGCIVTGVGYGIAQPYIYDRTSMCATRERMTFALALVMVMNYVAILICPFVIDYFQEFLHVKSERFAFGFNMFVSFGALFFLLIRRIKIMYENES